MTSRQSTRRAVGKAGLVTVLAAGIGARTGSAQPAHPVGHVTITQTQVSLLGSVSWGSGTLTFEGHTHRFRVRGLGVGGVGISELRANGDVYALSRLADFPGLYGAARAGAVAGSAAVRGGVWLRNPAGVSIQLRPQRTGVALQIGGDGLLIELE
ncbi:hypothetical protein DFH01_25605 [Falsiroseomonas bella]|uniref:DUF1134 domain-containing protein n=1 Tax=Falsiroseomonas bella TaxID=2184016 RepID=A0A317F6R2_9PROT|nr:hypothetical protein [Falsiroseomonas bella]PWS34395.1 hypothetical protein DFH01_25605 [Falsiroseomonas bella]